MAVSKKLSHGSWHTTVDFLAGSISAVMEVGTLCRAMAATNVFSFFCLITSLIMGSNNSMLVRARPKVSTLKVLVSQNSVLGCLNP